MHVIKYFFVYFSLEFTFVYVKKANTKTFVSISLNLLAFHDKPVFVSKGKYHIVLSLVVLITNPERGDGNHLLCFGFDLLRAFRSSDIRALPPRGEMCFAKNAAPY